MSELVLFPDVCGAVCPWLETELVVHVGTRVPTTRPAEFVVVTRTGGPRRNLVTDEASLTVDCWSTGPAEAHDLAQAARALIWSLAGTSQCGLWVALVTEVGGPADLPDPVSGQARCTFTVLVTTKATAVQAS